MLQITCATIVCLTQYLGLGTISYQSNNAIVLTTQRQAYYCTKYQELYTCSNLMGDSNKDY